MVVEYLPSYTIQEDIQNGYNNLLIEADSKMIISMVKKIQNGFLPSKLLKCWILEGGLERIYTTLTKILASTLSLVRRLESIFSYR